MQHNVICCASRRQFCEPELSLSHGQNYSCKCGTWGVWGISVCAEGWLLEGTTICIADRNMYINTATM